MALAQRILSKYSEGSTRSLVRVRSGPVVEGGGQYHALLSTRRAVILARVVILSVHVDEFLEQRFKRGIAERTRMTAALDAIYPAR